MAEEKSPPTDPAADAPIPVTASDPSPSTTPQPQQSGNAQASSTPSGSAGPPSGTSSGALGERARRIMSADSLYATTTASTADDATADETETHVPPPAYSETYGKISDRVSPLNTDAAVADDGRVNIRINERSRRMSNILLPALRDQLDIQRQQHDQPPPPPAYIPPCLGGSPDALPPPKMNVVIHVVGSRGDVQPFVALGKVLKDTYGHRVRLATHPTFKSFVEENGLEFFSIGGDPAELMAFMVKNPGLMPGIDTLKSGDIGKRRKGIAEMIKGCWRSCIEAGDGSGAEASDSAMKGWIADGGASAPPGRPFVADAIIANPPSFAHIHCAERLGIPLHMMFTMPWSPTQAFPHPLANIQSSNTDTSITNYVTYTLVDMLTWQGLGDVINRFRFQSLGLEPISLMWAPGMLARMRIPYTYCWSPALIPKPVDWAHHISISGFYFLNLASNYTPPPDLANFLASGPPPVYIGFGSIVVDDPNAMTELIFEAVRKTGQRALVSKGWGGFGADEMGIPDGVFMLGNVPHDWLFQYVSAVVHHGGAGTTAAGISAGKPTVVVPFFGDQPFWGAMVHRAGAGPEPIPHKKLTAENLADAITEALKPSSQDRAKELRDKMKQERGSDEGAVYFHQMLKTDRLRCSLLPQRAAVWRIRRTQIRLCAFAAYTLAELEIIRFSDLKPYRPEKYETDTGPWDPITGTGGAVVGTVSDIVMGIADMPLETIKSIKTLTEAARLRNAVAEGSDTSGSATPSATASTMGPGASTPVNSSKTTLVTGNSSSLSLVSSQDSASVKRKPLPESVVASPGAASPGPLSSQSTEGLALSPTAFTSTVDTAGLSTPRGSAMAEALRELSHEEEQHAQSHHHHHHHHHHHNHHHNRHFSRGRSPPHHHGHGKEGSTDQSGHHQHHHHEHHRSNSHASPSPQAAATAVAVAQTSLDAAVGTGKSVTKIIGVGLKSPMDVSMAISKGFHNVPKLYGEEVRQVDKVTGIGSGLKTATKEFSLGMYEGITGLVTQPFKGAKKEGAVGFAKGLGRGFAGISLKPGAAAFAVPAYAMKGVYMEIQKHFGPSVDNYIVAARTAQGWEEWIASTPEEKKEIVHNYLSLLKETNRDKKRRKKGPAETEKTEDAVAYFIAKKQARREQAARRKKAKGKKTCDLAGSDAPEDASIEHAHTISAAELRDPSKSEVSLGTDLGSEVSLQHPQTMPTPPAQTAQTFIYPDSDDEEFAPDDATPPAHIGIREYDGGADSPGQHTPLAELHAEAIIHDAELEAAIRASVEETTRGRETEDELIDRAIRASIAEIHRVRDIELEEELSEQQELQRAIAESRSSANLNGGFAAPPQGLTAAELYTAEDREHESHAKPVEPLSGYSRPEWLGEQEGGVVRDVKSPSGPGGTNLPPSSTANKTGASASASAAGPATHQAPSVPAVELPAASPPAAQQTYVRPEHHDEDLMKAIEESKQMHEELDRQRREEEIVMEYIKRVSLAESEFKNRSIAATAGGNGDGTSQA